MSWLGDLQDKAKASLANVQNDITSYLNNRITDVVVKAGEPQKGNQTAAQIAAGDYGGQGGIPGSSVPANLLANAGNFVSQNSNAILPLVAIAGLAFFMLGGRRSRRG